MNCHVQIFLINVLGDHKSLGTLEDCSGNSGLPIVEHQGNMGQILQDLKCDCKRILLVNVGEL